uniref:Uncharacterized protein n=1 Tax=Pipistrellus kuhlii TaxID=59472 RepID=A0A7J7VVF2_PIPKU|nr:hypothetical protein mPipKuh1_008280 [Pipistrellus kuhlii]
MMYLELCLAPKKSHQCYLSLLLSFFSTYQISNTGRDEKKKKMYSPSSKILDIRLLFFSTLSIVIRSYYCCHKSLSIRISEFHSCIIEENMESPYGFFYSPGEIVTSFLNKSRPSNLLPPR